jgi:DNA topoisomerase 2-associated protein PAT1
MTQYEKESIAKIQISQLVTDTPFKEDFYYQVYNALRNPMGGPPSGPPPTGNGSSGNLNWQQSLLVHQQQGGGSAAKSAANLQQQMQKLIEGRKSKPKGTSLSLEGALGKISLNSVKNPRQLIQISQGGHSKDTHSVPQHSRLTRLKVLKSIENVYSALLKLDDLKREGPPQEEEELEEWKMQINESIEVVWTELAVEEPIPFK